jgi:hypothetical protein
MSKYKLGTKWITPFGVTTEVIKEQSPKEMYIHFKILGIEEHRFFIRTEQECDNLKPLEEL